MTERIFDVKLIINNTTTDSFWLKNGFPCRIELGISGNGYASQCGKVGYLVKHMFGAFFVQRSVFLLLKLINFHISKNMEITELIFRPDL